MSSRLGRSTMSHGPTLMRTYLGCCYCSEGQLYDRRPRIWHGTYPAGRGESSANELDACDRPIETHHHFHLQSWNIVYSRQVQGRPSLRLHGGVCIPQLFPRPSIVHDLYDDFGSVLLDDQRRQVFQTVRDSIDTIRRSEVSCARGDASARLTASNLSPETPPSVRAQ